MLKSKKFAILIIGSNTNQTGGIRLKQTIIDHFKQAEAPLVRSILKPIKGMRNTMKDLKKGESMTIKTLTAVLHKEDDMYVAECPEVGTVSQGYSIEESLANLKEATELYLEEFPIPKIDKVLMTTFEAAVSA